MTGLCVCVCVLRRGGVGGRKGGAGGERGCLPSRLLPLRGASALCTRPAYKDSWPSASSSPLCPVLPSTAAPRGPGESLTPHLPRGTPYPARSELQLGFGKCCAPWAWVGPPSHLQTPPDPLGRRRRLFAATPPWRWGRCSFDLFPLAYTSSLSPFLLYNSLRS